MYLMCSSCVFQYSDHPLSVSVLHMHRQGHRRDALGPSNKLTNSLVEWKEERSPEGGFGALKDSMVSVPRFLCSYLQVYMFKALLKRKTFQEKRVAFSLII